MIINLLDSTHYTPLILANDILKGRLLCSSFNYVLKKDESFGQRNEYYAYVSITELLLVRSVTKLLMIISNYPATIFIIQINI